jgi:hypothetical protein
MSVNVQTAARNALLDAINTALGSGGSFTVFSGTKPALTTDADAGNALVVCTASGSVFAAASGGSMSKTGTIAGTVTGSGTQTAGYWRLKTSGGTVILQGTIGKQATAATSASTAANANALTFATSPTGFVAGMWVSGTGIPANTKLVSVGTTSVLDKTSTAGVGSGVTITAVYDLTIDNDQLANGQAFTLTSATITAPNA